MKGGITFKTPAQYVPWSGSRQSSIEIRAVSPLTSWDIGLCGNFLRIRGGGGGFIMSDAFRSVPELEAAIIEWINHRNAHPKPFIWTATAKSILLKRHRAKKTLANLAVGCK